MSRPRKAGIDYFPMDTDFFSDKKIRILKSRYGADGITIYIYILCEIYREGFYVKLDSDYEYIIADELNMSIEKVKQVMKFLLERSLLDSTLFQSDTIVTSQGIQRRFQEAIKSRASKSGYKVEKKYWLLSEEETQPFIKYTQNYEYSEKNPSYSEKNPSYSEKNPSYSEKNDINKSKGDKSKEKEKAYFPNDAKLNQMFLEFIAMRKEMKKPMAERDIPIVINKLQKLSHGDNGLAVCILEKSILNHWQDLYELKDGQTSSNRQTTFNNYPQRNYDFENLEKELLQANANRC